MRIGLDIDDVLYPWFETAHRICARAGITNGVTPTSWRCYEDYGCTDEQWFNTLGEATETGELYGAPPIPAVLEAVQQIHDADHTIHLVTARGFMRHGMQIRRDTAAWLDRWDIPHHSLTFTKDKTSVRTDLFLDDAPHNYDQLIGHTEVWLLEAPHNTEARAGRRVVASVADFARVVDDRANPAWAAIR